MNSNVQDGNTHSAPNLLRFCHEGLDWVNTCYVDFRFLDLEPDLEEQMGALQQHRCDGVDWTLYPESNRSSSKLLKKMIALQKNLSPFSKLHEVQSVSDLQYAVLEVKEIVESLKNLPGSIETMNQIEKYWSRGWKWIFEKQEQGEREKDRGTKA